MMVLAGVFGVMSAVYIEENLHLSNILDCVSVHLYLFEGVAYLVQSIKRDFSDEERWYRQLILFADVEFVAGAFLDVMVRTSDRRRIFDTAIFFSHLLLANRLSYFYLFDETADWNTALAVTWVWSATLWLHCALIYLGVFIYDATVNEKQLHDTYDHSSASDSSI